CLPRRGRSVRASGYSTTHELLEMCPAPGGMEAEWEAEWQARLIAWASEQTRRQGSDATWQAFWRTAIDRQPVKQVAADLGLTLAAVYHPPRRLLARLKGLGRAADEPSTAAWEPPCPHGRIAQNSTAGNRCSPTLSPPSSGSATCATLSHAPTVGSALTRRCWEQCSSLAPPPARLATRC